MWEEKGKQRNMNRKDEKKTGKYTTVKNKEKKRDEV